MSQEREILMKKVPITLKFQYTILQLFLHIMYSGIQKFQAILKIWDSKG